MQGLIGLRVCRWATLGLAAVAVTAATAQAEISLVDKGGLKLGFNFTGALAYVNTNHANFGAGVDGNDNVDWGEGFFKPGLTASFDTGTAGTLYGGGAIVGLATWGGPDAAGLNRDNPKHIDADQLYAGWKSGKLLPLGENAVDVSFGQQDFKVGDGFLVWDANTADTREGAYWLGPKTAFNRAGILRLNTTPVRGDFVYLKSDSDTGDTQLFGANVEYPMDKIGTFGAMFLKVTDVRDNFFLNDARDGMRVLDVRFQGTPAENVFVSAELTGEYTSGNDAPLKAYAWYAEAGYTLAKLPWAPGISYRYSQFSGDDPNTPKFEDFDPLFYGFGRGWGTWFQGEIVGEYLLFNSNERAHQLVLKAKPAESLGVGVQLYRFFLDKPQYFGSDTEGRHFADELNVYADWQATANLYLGAVAGIAKPGEAAKASFGNDKNYSLVELNATVTF